MIFRLLFSFVAIYIFSGCDEEAKNTSDGQSLINTTGQNSLGFDQDLISSYFYDFDSNVDVTFINYRQDGLVNTILYPNLISASDTINFKTFPDFLLKVDAATSNVQQNVEVTPFDETQSGVCLEINDQCPDIDGDGVLTNVWEFPDIPQNDTLTIYSHQFTSIDNLTWSQEDNRYKTNLKTDFPHLEDPDDPESDVTYSQWQYGVESVPIDANYAYDSLVYIAKIDTNITNPNGIFYIDESEFVKTDSVYSQNQIPVSASFVFENMNSLGVDSLMFHKITDCNYNGQYDLAEVKIIDYNNDGDSIDVFIEWTDGYSANGNACPEDGLRNPPGSPGCPDGEPCYDMNLDGIVSCGLVYEFEDLGDGINTDVEVYWDINANGLREQNEPFEDRNCNNVLDNPARTLNTGSANQLSGYTSEGNHSENDCILKSGTWFDVEGFCDLGNFEWDGDEIYIDKDDSGDWSEGDQLTKLMGSPARFIFDYTDQESPVPLSVITDQTGNIELKATGADVSGLILGSPIESNTINDNVTQYVPEVDLITTIFSNEIIAQMDQNLDKEYHITKLKTGYEHPTLGLIKEHSYNIFNDDAHITLLNYPSYFVPYGFYWTPDQMGDGFWNETFLAEEVMLYTVNGLLREGEHIQLDTLMVTSNGNYNIEVDYIVEKDDDVNVPAFDTPLTDTYKVTKTLIMTYIGSGVEYGERVTTWLGKNDDGPLGIVRDKVEIRWTEPAWVCPFEDNQPNPDCYDWTDYSRWELSGFRRDNMATSSGFGFLGKVLGKQKINIGDLDKVYDFDGDPFEPKRSAGMHPVRLIDNR